MQLDHKNVPTFLLEDKHDDATLWSELTVRFHHLRDIVENMRLETVKEAIGEKRRGQWRDTAARWEDPIIGQTVRAWDLIPYIDALDQNEITGRINDAKRLVPDLISFLENRSLTPAFLKTWGSFCSAAGAIEFIYFQNPNVGGRRSGKAGGDPIQKRSEDHKRWLAHYLLRFYKGRGSRGKAEEKVEQLIKAIIDRTVAVEWDVKWFKYYLDYRNDEENNQNYEGLRTVYREREFSLAEMKRLISHDPGDIPPLNLSLPEPLR